MDTAEQSFIEYLNYGLALAGVGLVLLVFRSRKNRQAQLHRAWLQAAGGGQA